MKDTKVEKNRNITMWIGLAMAAVMIGGGVATDYAQNSLPAPGSGGRFNPAPVGGGWGGGWAPARVRLGIRGRRHLLRGAARIRGDGQVLPL